MRKFIFTLWEGASTELPIEVPIEAADEKEAWEAFEKQEIDPIMDQYECAELL